MKKYINRELREISLIENFDMINTGYLTESYSYFYYLLKFLEINYLGNPALNAKLTNKISRM